MSRSVSSLVAAALALLMMASGPWLVLQSIAWARMIVVYTQQDSLGAALAKTFDGRHPCALCRQIRQGQQEEQQQGNPSPRERPEKMPEFFCEVSCLTVPLVPALAVEAPAFPLDRYSDFVESPPTPPPRAAVAVL